ncbi:MAG TPA: isoleucine--tRNA ligase [Polyangiaceae bacterium]|nr:isoleucine--tRNA ligase [Polyangiaceae bacterium]
MSQASPFEKVSAQVDFSRQEHEVLALWEEIDAFHESNRRREGGEPFVFYDGPPFATGTPHYGHLLAGTIKDIVPRYWNMRGHVVERRFGWDCHGLPIEALAQEALGLAGAAQIVERGIDQFNEQCRSMVQTYVAEWRKTITRMGRWVDFDNDYKTMDPEFMESVWWVFKQLWDRGRVYRSYRIMPYSWKLTTPLSNFEANSNYKDVQDPALTVRFRVTEPSEALAAALGGNQASILAWTTTPWTLPSNLALCVGPEIEYVVARLLDGGELLVLAAERVAAVLKKHPHEIVATLPGSALFGTRYQPLFAYFADRPNCFRVLSDAFVSTGDGTGIVHLAPAYGEDDFRVCRAADIELVDPLDAEARFGAQVPDYQGQFCKDADKAIIAALKHAGLLFHQDTIVHAYPFEERTDTPLIYRAIEAWYVRVTDLRDDLVAQNDTVGWVPEAVGKNRFGNWLRDANDWNISRNRFWGSCIPVWINVDDPEDRICVGSLAELEALSGERLTDLHKHFVDRVLIRKDGKTYRRTPEVLDCWFESGAMPYAQQHYPFAPGDAAEGPGTDPRFQAFFPANFIAEGLDQTRGWFYTLLILGTSLFGKSPYQNVIVNGLILAEDGQKMSKRKKNYPDPNEVLEKYGADALRAYLIDSPVVRGEPLRFSEKGLKEIVRTVVLPYWNALSFFGTYAAIDGYDPRSSSAPAIAERPELDRWVLSVLQSLVADVNREMESYQLYNVVPRLVSFIDDLTNWYIRSSRSRFWKNQDDSDKLAAYATLYEVLTTFAVVLAPFMPFVTEIVYQKLVRVVDPAAPASVHFADYPQARSERIDLALEERMTWVRRIVALGRKLREDHKLKVRQPLGRLSFVHRDAALRESVLASSELLKSELNVKEVVASPDESAFTSVSVKPNFASLKKKAGPAMPQLKPFLEKLHETPEGLELIASLERGEHFVRFDVEITAADVLFHRSSKGDAAVATDGQLTVVLDATMTPELIAEGHARELISQLQSTRKQSGLEVADRIRVTWACSDAQVAQAITQHVETISGEVLAVAFEQGETPGGSELDVNGVTVRVSLEKNG